MYIYIYIYIYIHTHTREGTQKFPELLKKLFLKCLYKFETLVPFEVLPLRLDVAIPAPLPMLERVSKIFNGNAVKGRQRGLNPRTWVLKANTLPLDHRSSH